jgi:hypothetical protein
MGVIKNQGVRSCVGNVAAPELRNPGVVPNVQEGWSTKVLGLAHGEQIMRIGNRSDV